MQFKISALCLVFSFLCLIGNSQGKILFPDLLGEDLRITVAENYTPKKHLSLRQAKDTIYANIDTVGSSVSCIYTGFTIPLEPGKDPSKTVYRDGSGINIEHVWPRSKGSSKGSAGYSDLYILYPSRVAVNASRSNKPFGEIDDDKTNAWYWKEYELRTIPRSNIDLYSESDENKFEPMESVKGDIARSMFYFFAIYNSDALDEGRSFFTEQLEVLLQWDHNDPPDEKEYKRMDKVMYYQGNQNPFIIDTTLADRMFLN